MPPTSSPLNLSAGEFARQTGRAVGGLIDPQSIGPGGFSVPTATLAVRRRLRERAARAGLGALSGFPLGGLGGRGRMTRRFPGAGGAFGGGGGGGGGGSGAFGTGPPQHGLLPGGLDPDPSQDSLTRARFNLFSDSIENLNNRGAGGRLEDAASAARSATAESLARSGIDPGSLQGALLTSGRQVGALDLAFGREAELDARLKQVQTQFRGQIAGMEQGRGQDLFSRFVGEERLGLERERLDLASQQQGFNQQQANLSLMMQFFSNPALRQFFGGGQ